MQTNNISKQKLKPTRYLKNLTPVILFIALIGSVISCSKSESGKYDIVKISGEASVYNVSKSYYYFGVDVDSANSNAMLIEEGDLLFMDDFIDCYQNGDKKEYHIEIEDSLLFINGKLSSIIISSKYNLFNILQNAEKSGMQLRSLIIDDVVPAEYLPLLKEIASNNKNVGLFIEHLNNTSQSILEMFDPDWIYLSDISQSNFNVLSTLNKTKSLWLDNDDHVITEPLPRMPRLTQLILSEIEIEENVIKNFLVNNPQIEKIVLVGNESSVFSMLENHKNLRTLSLLDNSDVLNLELFKAHDNLEALNILGEFENIKILQELQSLRWLSLPLSLISQEEFNSTLNNHENLEVLFLMSDEEIIDFDALNNLKKLSGLHITADSLSVNTSLGSLKQLKYLSIPRKTFEDENYMASLKNALPEAIIVPNDGFCLGSGWLILLFPLILLIVFIKKKFLYNKNI